MPTEGRALTVARARADDADALLALYFKVYGSSYPIALATDRAKMLSAMADPNRLWLVARDEPVIEGRASVEPPGSRVNDPPGSRVVEPPGSREVDRPRALSPPPRRRPMSGETRIAASVVFETDPLYRIGRIIALVVDPDYRKRHLSREITRVGVNELFAAPDGPRSLYATTRTNSIGPQMLFVREKFLPLGIFPNAHRLETYETLTLFAKFRPGTLDQRSPPARLHRKLAPLYQLVSRQLSVLGWDPGPAPLLVDPPATPPAGAPIEFEMFHAPAFVRRRFLEAFTDPYDRFFPFHEPNLILSATRGEVDIYAHFSPKDRYCTVVALTEPIHRLAGRLGSLFLQLRDAGISYIEILMGMEHVESLDALLRAQFLPSAIYPAMREDAGRMQDFVLMTRTLEPLNFRGMSLHRVFKPFADQYVELWKTMHLDSIEVFSGETSP